MSFLEAVKIGDAVVTGRLVNGEERYPRIRKVTKLTETQIILDNTDRYKRASGSRIGGIDSNILRIATQDDFDRETAERQRASENSAKMENARKHREELARLFPASLSVSVITANSNRDGEFNLEVYNVTETRMREIAETLRRNRNL